MNTHVKFIWFGILIIIASQGVYEVFSSILCIVYAKLGFAQIWLPIIAGVFAIGLIITVLKVIKKPSSFKLWFFILALLLLCVPKHFFIELSKEELINDAWASTYTRAVRFIYTLILFIIGYIKYKRIENQS